MPGVLCKI